MTVGVPPPRLPRAEPRRVRVEYEVEEQEGRWLLDEEDMPEIPLHDAVIQLLELVLQAFAEREARSALITSNLGCRWDPADARVGVDPDVLLVEPMPPEGEKTTTLRVWEPGHAPPRVAVEIVSEQSGRKDYVEGPARYARLGAHELWIFDPLLVGPPDTGGPFVLQVWRRNEQGAMAREHAGAGPARSEELGAWLVVTDGGTRLRLADDPLGERLWLTKAEAASRQAAAESRRAETESRRAEAEAERADERQRLLDAAEAEIARLRAELARRGSLRARQRLPGRALSRVSTVMSYDFFVMMAASRGQDGAATLVSDLLALFAHTEGCVVRPTDEWEPAEVPGAGPFAQIASVYVRMTADDVEAMFRPLKSFARRHGLRIEDPQVDEDCVDVQDECALPRGFA